MERFFDLAVKGDGTPRQPAGFTGQITANSFMKREFGRKLIEEYLPRWDLTHVLDTSGAYIPGHGTPTVILLGKNQPPVSRTIRTVLGIHGEPAAPADPAQGLVWQAIVKQIDHAGSVSEWMSAADSPRANFYKHPWTIGGGGAGELKETLDTAGVRTLEQTIDSISSICMTRLDDAYLLSSESLTRQRIPPQFQIDSVIGELVRDWEFVDFIGTLFPYDTNLEPINADAGRSVHQFLWPYKEDLWRRKELNGDHRELERNWWEWNRFLRHKFRNPRAITFSFVATSNNFVLATVGKIFHRSAPLLLLHFDASENDLLKLLGLLNSAGAGFWMKQVAHNKGSTVDEKGARQRTSPFEDFYEFTGTHLARFPIPRHLPMQLPTALVRTSTAMHGQTPAAALAGWGGPGNGDLRERLATARAEWHRLRRRMIAWQEELDWQIYEAFGLVESAAESGPAPVSLPEGEALNAIPPEGIELGQRAFEIVLARRMAAGETQTTWFERHGSTPVTEVPPHWPAAYRELVERRIRRIGEDSNIRLIEQPEYKRRWNTEPWDEQFKKAARDWLLARLEGYFFEGQRVCELKDGFSPAASGFAAAARPALTTTNQLAGTAQTDAALLAAAEALMGGPGFSMPKLIRELVESASVPFLPAQRYKASGLLKRQDWEHVWDLQRREDAIDAAEKVDEPDIPDIERARRKAAAAARKKAELGDIPVPPKYGSVDFKKSVWWSLRGKLDVPKERWVLYPGVERAEDSSPVIAWAGWDHAQQARALAEYFIEGRDTHGFPPEKLKLLLAGLQELLPWLHQWHGEIDPEFGDSPANAIQAFVEAETHSLGVTMRDLDQVRMGS